MMCTALLYKFHIEQLELDYSPGLLFFHSNDFDEILMGSNRR